MFGSSAWRDDDACGCGVDTYCLTLRACEGWQDTADGRVSATDCERGVKTDGVEVEERDADISSMSIISSPSSSTLFPDGPLPRSAGTVKSRTLHEELVIRMPKRRRILTR